MGKHPFLDSWCDAVRAGDQQGTLSLYEQDALLKPTLSSEIRRGHEAIGRYFSGDGETLGFLHQGIHKIQYTIEQELRFDQTIILMGVYEFATPSKTIKAHFTFVLKEKGSGFSILAQHSSLY